MNYYGLISASDFLTGNLEIPRFFLIMLNVFLSTFVQMFEFVWVLKPLKRVIIWWLSHMQARVERFLLISLFRVHEEKDMHAPVQTWMKNKLTAQPGENKPVIYHRIQQWLSVEKTLS